MRRRRNTQNVKQDVFANLHELEMTLGALLYVVESTMESLSTQRTLSSEYIDEYLEPRLRSLRMVSKKVSPLASQTEAFLLHKQRQNPAYYIEDDYYDEY